MKALIALIVSVSLLSMPGLVQAVKIANANSKGGKGIQGTIVTLGTRGFAMTLKDGRTIDVLCTDNTKFMSGKDAVSPSAIKEGITVSIQGVINSPTQYTATVVTILGSKPKKKTT